MADSVMISSLTMPLEYLIDGTRPRCRSVSLELAAVAEVTHGVDFQIPWFAGLFKVNDNLLIG